MIGRAIVLLATLAACRDGDEAGRRLTGGDPARGRRAVARYGCGACHDVPGVAGAHGRVGPPLGGIGRRVYLAGSLTNTPEHLERWITHPQAVQPGNAMPDLDVTEQDARDIAAHLYTLR